MRRIGSTIAGVGALVVGMTLSAWAQGTAFVDSDGDGISDGAAYGHWMHGRMGRSGGGGGGGVNLTGITLTTDQQTQVTGLQTTHRTNLTALQTTLQTDVTALKTLMSATTPDQTAINAQIAVINTDRSNIQKEDTSYRAAVLNALTPDQRGVLDAQRIGLTRAGITLTADQQTQLDKLTSAHQTTVSSLQTALQTDETVLKTLMSATTPDQTSINAQIDKVSADQASLQKENANFQLSVRGLLTADQQATLAANGGLRGAGVGRRAGHGPGPGGHAMGMAGHGRR